MSLKDALKHIGVKRLAAMVLSIVAAVCVVLAISLPLYRFAKEGIELRGEYATEQLAEELNHYLMAGKNSLLLSGFVVDKMIQLDASTEEIHRYLTEESERMVETVDAGFNGLYGWLDGAYLTTTGFEPDSSYIPTQRPWYLRALEKQGDLVYVEPYLDARTGTMVMTLAKMLSDGESVIALDFYLNGIQELVDEAAVELKNGEAMVLDLSGGVVAHSIHPEIGHNYLRGDNNLGTLIAGRIFSDNTPHFEVTFEGREYVVYNMENEGGWHSVSVLASDEFYSSLKWLIAACCILIAVIVGVIFTIFLRISMRSLIAQNLNLQLSAIADIYTTVVDINIPEDTFIEINNHENLSGVSVRSFSKAQASLYAAVDKQASQTFLPIIREFLDLSKLNEKLKNRTNISLEFLDKARGWCRGSIIVAKRDSKGNVTRVLWAIESIDEEKRHREELIHLAETDRMTGIFNRASGEQKIQEQLSMGLGGMFMMLDIDHFKSINDQFGHSVGDQVIKATAGCLRNAFRNGDVVLRLGGDEFAAYAPGVFTREIGDSIIGRFFRYLGEVTIPEMGNKPVCVSVGVSFCPPDNSMDFREIYEAADQRTYQSKKTEGNMVTYAEEETYNPQETGIHS